VSGQTRGHNSVKSQPIFKTFSLEDSLVNLQYSRCQKITPCPAYVTLWNINVRKQAVNDKLRGSVATYLLYGGVVNDKIKKGLLLSPSVKKKLKSVNI